MLFSMLCLCVGLRCSVCAVRIRISQIRCDQCHHLLCTTERENQIARREYNYEKRGQESQRPGRKYNFVRKGQESRIAQKNVIMGRAG